MAAGQRGSNMEKFAPYLILIGRVVLSFIFIQSGWGKIFGYAATVEHMNAAGVPGALLPLVILPEPAAGFACCSGCSPATRPSRSPVSACLPPGSSITSPATWAR